MVNKPLYTICLPLTYTYRRLWANYGTQVPRESTRCLIGSPAGLLRAGSKIHVLHMLQLYHREISCCNNEVGWGHEEEKQTSLFLSEKHSLYPYFTLHVFYLLSKISVITV